MPVVNDFRWQLGSRELVPIIIGGMGVDVGTPQLALEAARLGGVGHISDAMAPFVCDRRYGSNFTARKAKANQGPVGSVCSSQFDLTDLRTAQAMHVEKTMSAKNGVGLVFINVMEKLTMASPLPTLQARLLAAMDGGIDGITLSAGLHTHSMRFMSEHPRFRDVLIGIIVSSARALRIFLRSAQRGGGRLPDYIIVEGPLAGGHLGFGEDWRDFELRDLVGDVLRFLAEEDLQIPVIAAGGIFTGTDAVAYLQTGVAAVQVATRFVITQESGFPAEVKQRYFQAEESDVLVSSASPTGYLIRMLAESPSLGSNTKPQCAAYGYALSKEGRCQYIDAYNATPCGADGKKLGVKEKICLCYHFGRYNCYACGHFAYRLRDTSLRLPDGSYYLPPAQDIFLDYQYSADHQIAMPVPPVETARCA